MAAEFYMNLYRKLHIMEYLNNYIIDSSHAVRSYIIWGELKYNPADEGLSVNEFIKIYEYSYEYSESIDPDVIMCRYLETALAMMLCRMGPLMKIPRQTLVF